MPPNNCKEAVEELLNAIARDDINVNDWEESFLEDMRDKAYPDQYTPNRMNKVYEIYNKYIGE